MKKSALLAVAAALALPGAWAAINSAYAPSGAHYANGSGDPVCTKDSDLNVTCTATTIGGVGHTNADLLLSATYSFTVQCRNNGNQIVDVKTQTRSSPSVSNLPSSKNGQLAVPSITATAPTIDDMKAAAKCPNPNWTKEVLGGLTVSFLYTLTFDHFDQPAIMISGS